MLSDFWTDSFCVGISSGPDGVPLKPHRRIDSDHNHGDEEEGSGMTEMSPVQKAGDGES